MPTDTKPSKPEDETEKDPAVKEPAGKESAGKEPAGKVDITPEKAALFLNMGLKVSQSGSKITIKWGKVAQADGYEVFVQYCGKNFKKKPTKTIKNAKKNSIKITKINGKKLNLKKNYKVYVTAYKKVGGKKVKLGKTIIAHIVGQKNTKYTNIKKVTVSKTKYTLKKGRTAKIKAKTVRVHKNKKELGNTHAKKLRYASSNKKVATVTKNGKIKAVNKGKCSIYVYARNGYAKKITVIVK